MRRQLGVALVGVLLAASVAFGQAPSVYAPVQTAPQQPDQPVLPQAPMIQAVPPGQQAPQQAPPPPFTLTAEEERQLGAVLSAWQDHSSRVKTFRASFVRYEYDEVFGSADKPRFVDEGSIAFGSPDRGMYSVEKPRQEYWICDGKAIFEYDYQKRRVTEHKLPPEMQGREIANGPLPFLFGAPAQQLRQRYFLRLITPANSLGKEIWLQAVPRFQQDAANFRHAELILAADSMTPAALQLHQPGGKNRATYVFKNVVVNDPLGWLKGDPFRAVTPLGWERVVEEPPQVGSRESSDTRR